MPQVCIISLILEIFIYTNNLCRKYLMLLLMYITLVAQRSAQIHLIIVKIPLVYQGMRKKTEEKKEKEKKREQIEQIIN